MYSGGVLPLQWHSVGSHTQNIRFDIRDALSSGNIPPSNVRRLSYPIERKIHLQNWVYTSDQHCSIRNVTVSNATKIHLFNWGNEWVETWTSGSSSGGRPHNYYHAHYKVQYLSDRSWRCQQHTPATPEKSIPQYCPWRACTADTPCVPSEWPTTRRICCMPAASQQERGAHGSKPRCQDEHTGEWCILKRYTDARWLSLF